MRRKLAAPRGAPRPWSEIRFRTALESRGIAVGDLANRLRYTHSHTTRLIRGERPLMPEAIEAIRSALGEVAWSYAIGQSDHLPPKEAA